MGESESVTYSQEYPLSWCDGAKGDVAGLGGTKVSVGTVAVDSKL